jgi:hypothetical protein
VVLLSITLLRQERYDETERLLSDTLSKTNTPSQESYAVAHMHSLLGDALTGLGRFEEAESLLLDAYANMLGALPQDFPHDAHYRRLFIRRIVRLYDAWGRPDDASAWRDRFPPD